MKHFFFLTLFFLLGFSGLNAQTKSIKKSMPLSEITPESVGISTERLSRIDKMCEQEVANGNLPGIVSLVARNGKIVHWKAYLSLIHISEPTRRTPISYAVFCL